MVVHLAVGMRGPPTPIVMMMEMFFLLCGRIAHPFGHRKGGSHSDGIKHARVEPGAPSAPTNQRREPTHLRTAMCARFFKQNDREHDTN